MVVRRAGRSADRRRDDRGAVALVAGLLALALTFIAGLTMDIGVQRVARTDMQSLADVVALDLARDLDCRTVQQMGGLPAVEAAAARSRDRNRDTVGSTPQMTVQLGAINAQGQFVPTTRPEDVPGAVLVGASTTVPFAFGILTSGGAGRTAMAQGNNACATTPPTPTTTPTNPTTTPTPTPTNPTSTPTTTPTTTPTPTPGANQVTGCLRIGSSLLDVDARENTISPLLLNDALNLNAGVLRYDGLVGTQLTLGDLAAALGVGTVDQLLSTQVTAAQLATAIVTAVRNDGVTSNDGVVSVLNASVISSLASSSSSAALGPIVLGRILAITPGNNAALTSSVNVLDLVSAGALAANGSNALAVPQLNAPGVSAKLYVVQPPQIACGSAIARTSQVRLELTQGVGLVAEVTLAVDLATASGGISSISCTNDVPTNMKVHLDQLALATASAKVTALLGLASVTIPSSSPAPGAAGTYDLPLPSSYTTPYRVSGATTLAVGAATAVQLGPIGLNLRASAVNDAIANLTSVVNSQLVDLLHLRLGGADLFAVSAECSVPVLIGAPTVPAATP